LEFVLSYRFFAAGILAAANVSGEKQGGIRAIEDFTSFPDGSFPLGWKSRGGEGSDVYTVRSNHDIYLEARAVESAVAIAKSFPYDTKHYAFLQWQWRVLELPHGAASGLSRPETALQQST
jgi:hypothetical protein